MSRQLLHEYQGEGCSAQVYKFSGMQLFAVEYQQGDKQDVKQFNDEHAAKQFADELCTPPQSVDADEETTPDCDPGL